MSIKVISEDDKKLVKVALERLDNSFDEPLQSVACAARTKNGDIITAMNFKHYAFVTCAEMAALAIVQNEYDSPIELITSVRYIHGVPEVINACGRCRQVLIDHWPDVNFVLKTDDGLRKAGAQEVLPYTYIHYPGGKK